MLDKDFAGRFREELKTRHIVFSEDDGEFTVSPGSLVSDEDGFVCLFEAVAAEKGDIFQLEGFQVHSRFVGSALHRILKGQRSAAPCLPQRR